MVIYFLNKSIQKWFSKVTTFVTIHYEPKWIDNRDELGSMHWKNQPTFITRSAQALVTMCSFNTGGSVGAGGTSTLVHPRLTESALVPR